MFKKQGEARRHHPTKLGTACAALIISLAAFIAPVKGQGNSFNSGSTGVDGTFAPTSGQVVTLPESGVFNFTTVNIPSNVTISFTRNSRNTPVTILASGNVTIIGNINVSGGSAPSSSSGIGGAGGPGGFDGGDGGCNADATPLQGTTGDGPGGGTGGGGVASAPTNGNGGGGGGYAGAGGDGTNSAGAPGRGGPRYGTISLLPLIGGSGGGGAGSYPSQPGCTGGGGGGGGAILIASSGTITLTGDIFANGGIGGEPNVSGGGGSGGAIRLVANTLTGTNGSLLAAGGRGGTNAAAGGNGSDGYIRMEAYDRRSFNPGISGAFFSYATPNPVAQPNAPRLRISSVGGVAAPTAPLGALHAAPDIILPTTQTNPLEVVIEGANIPLGTLLDVVMTPERGTRVTTRTGGLTGTEAASTTRASISLPVGVCVISATAIIDLTASNAPPLYIDGERIRRLEVAATFGGTSEVTYVTMSGRRIKRASN